MIDHSNDAFFLLYDKLFFQIYSAKPHSSIEGFVKKHTYFLRVLPSNAQ
jgi:hypothetical protein